MVKGIGTDIIEISRVGNAVDRNNRFLQKYFTKKEIQLFEERNYNKSTIAANFAIKEAVSKALGTGFRGFSPKDIESLRDDLGKPYVVMYNGAKALMEKLMINTIFVTVSHNKDNVVAFVLFEGAE